MNQSRKLTEGALFIAIFFVLMLASYIPILSGFIVFLMPIPFVLYGTRHGWKLGTLVLIVALLISGLFFTVLSLPFTLLMGLGGLVIGQSIYKKHSAYETLALGVLGFVFGILFMFGFYQLFLGVNFINEFETIANEQIGIYISMLEGLGGANGDVGFETLFKEQIQFIITLIPAILVFSAVAIALIVQWLSYKIMNRIEKENYHFPPFRNFKLPGSVLWLYLIVIFVSLINLDETSVFYLGIVNAVAILELLLTIQGFSFIFFFTHHKNYSRSLPIISVILTLIFPIFLLYFVRILGIIDIGLSLKDRLRKNKENQK